MSAINRAWQHAEAVAHRVDTLIALVAPAEADAWVRRDGTDGWTAAEVCGHVAEMLPFWAEHAAELARTPGMTLGRETNDPRRVGGVRTGAEWSPAEAAERVRAAAAKARAALLGIPATEWDVQGHHPERGTESVEQIVDLLLVYHLDEHIAQTRAILG